MRESKRVSEAAADVVAQLLRAEDVAAMLSVSLRTLWRMVRDGNAPQPVRFNRKLVRWRRQDVMDYVRRLAASREG